ncbi:hypothetical protein [Candidatus Trichorickettsia mobilis]|uniref:hypothetical protein n=1 Tax=Candidatus Trichorickettsia mobilis TaxID=1346319 RepID=UPI002930928A|nr:hypothetical protein [Candidatus Trichorickettsia mobilis]
MNIKGVSPDDVLADTENFANLNGITVRKGSIAAFLKNIDFLEDFHSSSLEKAAALDMIRQLAPAIIASGLHKHAIFKNKVVQEVVENGFV